MDADVEVLFRRPSADHFVGRGALRVRLSPDYNRKTLPHDYEAKIQETWTRKTDENSTLYNGTKFRLHSVDCDNDDRSANVTFNLGVTCYRDFIGTNWSPNAKLYRGLGTEEWGDSQAFLSDALGVGALLETSDGFVVLLKRSMSCAEAPGLWDIPGGHPEPKAVVGNKSHEEINLLEICPEKVVDEIFNSTLSEIVDEVNIPQDTLTDPLLVGIARNTTSAGRPSSEYYVRCNLTSEEVRTLYNKGTQAEADESNGIMFLPVNQITNLQVMKNDIWCEMAPSAKGCLMMFGLASNKGLDCE